MRFWLIFSAVFGVSHGVVDWLDLRAGPVSLPTKKSDLGSAWKPLEQDATLKLSWYLQVDDARFLLAFDQKGNVAGCRAVFLKSDLIGDDYNDMYLKSGLFEEGTYLGKDVYYSTVLFTPEKVLKSGGRRKTPEDEVAAGVYVKVKGKYERLLRNGCDNFNSYEQKSRRFYEQGCQDLYGLVFSMFGRESECDSLIPFYAIYDPQDKGELMGFGWLSYSTFSEFDYKSSTTFYKSLTEESFAKLFPNRPACLANFLKKYGLTALDVWLSYSASQEVNSCSGGSWLDSHCQRVRSKRPGSSEDF